MDALAAAASEANAMIQSIGARRLITVVEKVLKDASFNPSDYRGQSVMLCCSVWSCESPRRLP